MRCVCRKERSIHQNGKHKRNGKQKKEKEQQNTIVSDGDEYAVESILESKTMLEGETQYLIKWKGYDDSGNTWEPKSMLDGCSE